MSDEVGIGLHRIFNVICFMQCAQRVYARMEAYATPYEAFDGLHPMNRCFKAENVYLFCFW
jgi:hypothetical protein